MIITDKKKLQDIQKEFHQKFPYLKIEFYKGHHEAGQGSPIREQLNPNKTIGAVRKVHAEGDFSVNEELSVAQFEQTFSDLYGLNVQVFRKSGNIWMQTTSTDSWTLGEQNRKGGSSELHFKEKYDQ